MFRCIIKLSKESVLSYESAAQHISHLNRWHLLAKITFDFLGLLQIKSVVNDFYIGTQCRPTD